MKFSVNRPVKIIMIGAGGTGGYAAPHVYRLLHTLHRPVRFIIADGDIVEEKNLVRQNFVKADLGRNKAQVMAERYASAFGMEIEYIPGFIENDEQLMKLLTPEVSNSIQMSREQFAAGFKLKDLQDPLVILIGCVDNNKSRQMCHRVYQQMDELVYIDSGNGEYSGQVVCGIKRKKRNYYKPVGEIYPDVLEETDKFPTELSCAEAAVSAPQSIAANIMASTAIVTYIFNILVLGDVTVRSATFSTKTIYCRPLVAAKRKKVA